MNDAIQIWALYEQTAAQPPQYQPTANDKKASQLNAAAQKPQTPPAIVTQPQQSNVVTSKTVTQIAPTDETEEAEQEQQQLQTSIDMSNIQPAGQVQPGMLADNFNKTAAFLHRRSTK